MDAWARALQRFFEHLWVRAALSAAIVLSLVPVPWVSRLDPLFFALFASEFLLRVFLLVQGRPTGASDEETAECADDEVPGTGDRRWLAAVSLLLVDLLALLSFLPLRETMGARWLRVVRLTRMLLLVGYWGALVRDLWSVLLRRERARQILLMGIVVAGLSFAGAVLMHNVSGSGVDVNDDGEVNGSDMQFVTLLWWAFRQVQDPGNMLATPLGPAVMLISLALTVFGLFLVSFLIGLGTDVVHELLELSRLRPSGLHGHTVIVNIAPSTRRLLHELVRYTQKLFPGDTRMLSVAALWNLLRRTLGGGRRILVVGNSADPPDFLRLPGLGSIVYRQRPLEEEDLLTRADLLVAKRILLMADEHDRDPDTETIRTLVTLVERIRVKERSVPPQKKRLVIAEILDESNVEAAHAALSTGLDRFRGFVVPTEKLLALFFASVVRRPGIERVLEELLTSFGHEVYTCFFRTPGLDFSITSVPHLGPDAGSAVTRLQRLGRDRMGGRVVPIGLLLSSRTSHRSRDFEVWINPTGRALSDGQEIRGFIGLADQFASIRTLAQVAASAANDDEDLIAAPPSSPPLLARTRRRKTTRVLVCGFRPGSIYMLEELFRSDPRGEVLVLVEDDAARRRAATALEAHTALVLRGLLKGRHGTFEPVAEGTYHFLVDQEHGASGHSVMHVCVADFVASRHWVDLPAGFGHAADLDAIIFVASDPDRADKRTTTALLKLEPLFEARGASQPRPRVVAELIDGKLAQRLEHRYRALGIDDVRVFSIQELRSYFLFQAVVVPGFDRVYAELLGSWGQSFVHKHVDVPGRGPCTFSALAEGLRAEGEVLIAVELGASSRDTALYIAPGVDDPGGSFELERLQGVWVVAPDSSETPGCSPGDGR